MPARDRPARARVGSSRGASRRSGGKVDALARARSSARSSAGVGLLPFAAAAAGCARTPGSSAGLRRARDAPARRVGPRLAAPGCTAGCSLASALPALALTALFFGVEALRPLIGGIALGTRGAPRADGRGRATSPSSFGARPLARASGSSATRSSACWIARRRARREGRGVTAY